MSQQKYEAEFDKIVATLKSSGAKDGKWVRATAA
jgi:hypothetical protein